MTRTRVNRVISFRSLLVIAGVLGGLRFGFIGMALHALADAHAAAPLVDVNLFEFSQCSCVCAERPVDHRREGDRHHRNQHSYHQRRPGRCEHQGERGDGQDEIGHHTGD